LQNASVLIVTDEPEFARLLTACWRAERDVPAITVLASNVWNEHEGVAHELAVVGPLREGKLPEILQSLAPASAVILCAPIESTELAQLRRRHPRFVHVPLR
jgi:hypothetical protein